MLDRNTLLVVIGFLIFIYLFANQRPGDPIMVRVNDNSELVNRTGSDWNRSGTLVKEVGLDNAVPIPPFTRDSIPEFKSSGAPPFTEEAVQYKGTIAPWTKEKSGPRSSASVTENEFSGPGYRDSYGQLKPQDEIYPNYYNKYEVYTSDNEPWWRNQHFWPYYTRGYNLQYRYPYYDWWRRPYYYNYWASPYYPSRTVLIKPYLRDQARKSILRDKLALDFRRAKINDSPRST